ncbi:MAG TPA: hypothetical protein VH969_21025 [Actinophytocola sp.]|uniref:hypothetical protein n=1 Tax=Actinophytocola sp. TaxID=1872138 RepID=UPI002F94862F
MAQLSFYSADANPPARGDIAGLLCGPGRLVSFGGVTARLSVPVPEAWRGQALRRALADRGVDATLYTSGDGLLLRTAFRRDLTALAAAWTAGTEKTCPPGVTLGGAALRLWVLAAGEWTDGSYLLRLDPAAPDTHETLAGVVTACGLPAHPYNAEDGGPGLRISGRRRLARLAELVGRPPSAAAESHWPAVSRVRRTA